ncbi:TSUP family transporter [Flavobacterium sp.]|uniref:TSUP family transporter n=1 Tax=Flavobacterium sp. TaxID=239 RepID=UPI003D0B2262
MEYIIIAITSLLGAGLTLFSGFGLGTLLLPVFGLFFPIEIAVVLTAIVHFTNNLFKLILFGKKADQKTTLKFGIPAICFSFLGAYLLKNLTTASPLFTYTLLNKHFEITILKIVMGSLLLFFALFDTIPSLKNLKFNKKYLSLGGILSGFFGGLSGHQGALRAAFLVRSGLSKESFIATGVLIACLVDISRLSLYIPKILNNQITINLPLLLTATFSAFVGVYFGNKILQKTTFRIVQNLVTVALFLYGVLMIFGLI